MKQRILVLGGDTFVASRVHAALAASDWATPVSAPPGSIDGFDAVFNGALGDPHSILSCASRLYPALARAPAAIRAVHLSSMTVYGSREGRTTEDAPLQPDLGAYGAAQIEAESLASAYPRSVILRPGCEYGPGCPQWSERIARLLLAHRLGDLGAAGDGVCNLLYVDDLVAAVMAALRLPTVDGQVFNLAMAGPPTWNAYLSQFARELGAVPLKRIGARRLRLETKFLAPPLKVLEIAMRRLRRGGAGTPSPITPSLVSLCAQRITLASEKAERLLDLTWTPLHDGLRHAAAAMRSS